MLITGFAQGAHPKEISTRLGHSSISVTMDTYGHLLPSLDARLTDGLDAAYEAASRPTADGTVPATGTNVLLLRSIGRLGEPPAVD